MTAKRDILDIRRQKRAWQTQWRATHPLEAQQQARRDYEARCRADPDFPRRTSADFRAAYPDKNRAYQARYRAAHRQQINARARAAYATHPTLGADRHARAHPPTVHPLPRLPSPHVEGVDGAYPMDPCRDASSLSGLYARLYETWAPAHTVTPGQPWTPWSVEELVAILEAYVAEWGAYPPPSDLHPDCGLPHRATVRRVCGSVEGWYARVPGVRSRVRHCLKCGREGSHWVCTACRWKATSAVGEAVAGDGSWMTGTLVQEPSGPVTSEELEMIGIGPPVSKTRRKRG